MEDSSEEEAAGEEEQRHPSSSNQHRILNAKRHVTGPNSCHHHTNDSKSLRPQP
jgi:hypothetical protein